MTVPDFGSGVELAALPEGRMIAGCVDGTAVIVANDRGRYRAVSATCTHMGAPLQEGLLVNGEVRCPWHHARFSLSTGEAVGAPAFAPLRRFVTVVRDGRVFLSEFRPSGLGAELGAASPSVGHATAVRVVIVGGGASGFACAEWLTRRGFAGVTLICDEPDPPYDRTVCSKQYLIGMKSRQDCFIAGAPAGTGAGGAGANGMNLRLGCKVDAIDPDRKTVRLAADERLPFDVLVLATGGEPVRPKLPGLDLANVYQLRTLSDADALIGAARKAKRVAVIGASFIGLEVAASLRQRSLEVAVVSPEEVPLQKQLGAEIGAMIQTVHEEKGVRFHLGRQVRQFDGRRLALDDGSSIEADFVVLGTGIKPRTELARVAGLAVAPVEDGGGVIVNERLESSVPGIFAIGDIAQYPDPHTGRRIRVEHWVHAQRQGQHVARVIMGQANGFADPPFFWSAHFDTGLRYLGHVDTLGASTTEGSLEARSFSRCQHGTGSEKAYITCNRDLDSLRAEADWDQAI